MAAQEFTTEELANEIWKPVPGYEGLYSASSLGRIRTERSGPTAHKPKGYILKPNLKKNGRYNIALYKNRRYKTFRVHHVIALTFHGPCPAGKEVDHVDCVKTNDRASNLEYVTHAENKTRSTSHLLDARGDGHYSRTRPHLLARGDRHGSKIHPERWLRGSQHPNSKMSEDLVRALRQANRGGKTSQRELGRRFGISQSTVGRILKGNLWEHVK